MDAHSNPNSANSNQEKDVKGLSPEALHMLANANKGQALLENAYALKKSLTYPKTKADLLALNFEAKDLLAHAYEIEKLAATVLSPKTSLPSDFNARQAAQKAMQAALDAKKVLADAFNEKIREQIPLLATTRFSIYGAAYTKSGNEDGTRKEEQDAGLSVKNTYTRNK